MPSGAAFLAAASATGLLILSGLWAEYRFRGFEKLPAHFNAAGKATRLASRRVMIWLTPVTFAALIALFFVLLDALPPEYINGDPDVAIILISAALVGAQALILWLTVRWAREQR